MIGGCYLFLLLICINGAGSEPGSQEGDTPTRLPPHVASRKVPQLFRADPYFYVNKMGNCPGNFMPSVSDEGLSVDNLDACLKQCSQLAACKSVAVRMRDLPYLLDSGAQSQDNVSRCWLKTLDSCPNDFVSVGKNVEATMLTKNLQTPMEAVLVAKSSNPYHNTTATCTVDGLPPPIPTTISIEISSENSDTSIWLGPFNLSRINATAYAASASVPGLPRGATSRRLMCFAANLGGSSIRRFLDIRPLALPKFTALKLFFDEATNSSARIRWGRWNASVDTGDPPIIGYKIFVEPLADEQVVVTQPSSFVTEEVLNDTFQAVIDERACGSRAWCQFRLLDLEPQSRYLIGVMPMRPDAGGDNGTISWSLNPLVTLCGRPSRIETMTGSIRWRRGMPQIVISFEPPRKSANCPDPGEFILTYSEIENPGNERLFKVPGLKRQAEINDVRTEANYTLIAWYRNTEQEDGEPLRMTIWTGIPLKIRYKSSTSQTVTLEWSVSPSPAEFPTQFRIAYWQDSAKIMINSVEDGNVVASLLKFIAIEPTVSCRRNAASVECLKTVSDLRQNSLHYFAVIALNSVADEMYRSETMTVTTTCEVPAEPYNVTVSRQTKSAITLQWQVNTDESCPIDLIQIDLSNRQTRTVVNVTNSKARSYEFAVAELTAWLLGSRFALAKVRVMNVRGMYSDWSEPTELYVESYAITAPNVVTHLMRTTTPSPPPSALEETTDQPTPPVVIMVKSSSRLTSQIPDDIIPQTVTPLLRTPQATETTSQTIGTTEAEPLLTRATIFWHSLPPSPSPRPSSPSTSYSVWSRTTTPAGNFGVSFAITTGNTALPEQETEKNNDSKVSPIQTMIIGIVVGCGCVASALAVLCILLFKKKKLFSRNKVSRFSNSPSSGAASDGGIPTVACPDYFIKATGLNPGNGQPFLTPGNGMSMPRCLPDVAAFCSAHHAHTHQLLQHPQQPTLQQQQQMMPTLCTMNISNAGFQTPPTDNSSPASATTPDQQALNCNVNCNGNSNSNNEATLSKSGSANGTLQSNQALNISSVNNAWPSPALVSAGSAIHSTTACTAIRIDRLKQAILDRRADDLALYRKEFASLIRKPDKPQDIGRSKLNAVRNRYKDVFPYDYNCVLLDDEANAKEPIYINASYIKGASGDREYVASQGPCSATVGEFWKMIWQLNITRVVMLTNAHEKGKVKCYKYWPDVQESSVFDGITVETLNEARFACYVKRTLRIRIRQHSDRTETCSRVITQFQFTNWPDHRVVRFATPVVTFLRKLNKHISNNRTPCLYSNDSSDDPSKPSNCSPVLVHCSAGIGRTGTLLAADIAIKKAEQSLAKHSPHDVEVDLRSIVNTLREQRHKMVQNLEQYMFLYDLVYEALSCYSVKPTTMPLLIVGPVTIERLQREFDVLERTKPTIARQEFDLAMDLKNAGKNRIQRILPASFCRVQLLTPSDDKQDYISAIWLDGYQRPRSLIAAQSPMPHTVSDFWSVVWDYNVAAIVSLDPQPCLDPTYCPIGPSEETEAVYHGAFKIKSLRRTAVSCRSNEETSRPYVVDVLSVTNSQKKADTGREVRHFGYTGAWLPNVRGIPSSVEQFAEFIIGIDETRRAAQGRPVIVHCLDAATRTGLTLLTILLKEQCDCDDEVDVFNVLKTIRNFRPELIPNLEQYSFAYGFLGHVLGSECSS